MTKKYHINGKGIPSVCHAQKNCPFGGSDSHYNSREEAQKAADKHNEEAHGLLSELKQEQNIVRKADTPGTKAELELRKKALENESSELQGKSYYNRCYKVDRLDNYTVNETNTHHYSEDRKAKDKMMSDFFGEGNLIGHYKVNHQINRNRKGDQVMGIYDTGQVKIYDVNTGKLITTFIPHEKRIEVMLVRAGEVPDEAWLNTIKENKAKLDTAWEEYDTAGKERRERRKAEKESTQNSESTQAADPVQPVQPAQSSSEPRLTETIPDSTGSQGNSQTQRRETRNNSQRRSKNTQKKSEPKTEEKPKQTFKKDVISDFFRKNSRGGSKPRRRR